MVRLDVVPTGIEAKASQFAAICARDGYPDATLTVSDGRISRMSLVDPGGRQRFFAEVRGRLCEYHDVEEGDDGRA